MAPLFHITTSAAWQQAQADGAYRGDTLATEGFIHCSFEHQVLEVADRLFRGRADLLLLVIERSVVVPEVRFENTEGGTELYPHMYGPLNLDAVLEARPFPPGDDGRFAFPQS
jgi:uncharacterized protein (DUF952 family)